MCSDGTQCRQGFPDAPDATRCDAWVQDAQDAQDADSRIGESGRNTTVSDAGYLFADDGGGKAVKLVRGGWIAGMLERRTRESRAIIQAFELGYEIKGRVSSLEIFPQCDSAKRVVKGKITSGLVPDSDS